MSPKDTGVLGALSMPGSKTVGLVEAALPNGPAGVPSALPAVAPETLPVLSGSTPSSISTIPKESAVDFKKRRESSPKGLHEAKLRQAEGIQTLPENNLLLVFPALMTCMFLAALDSTIVATALPTICEKLQCSASDYSWIGTAYLLGAVAPMPLIGKLSGIVGRKPVMFSGILLFILFSGLCGGAKTSLWMIVCRAFQGVGGGTIMSMTQIVISDIVSLQERGKYGASLGGVWALASVAGPIFGGLITNNGEFAWCFYLNLPTGFIAIGFLAYALNLHPVQKKPLSYHFKTFDFVGLALLITGIICLLIGFSEASTLSWSSTPAIALVTVGAVVIVGACVWECFTTRDPLLPPRLFKNRTTAGLLVGNLCHGISFMAASYYLVVYFQACEGVSPLMSAVKMISFMVVSALAAMASGLLVSKTGKWKTFLCGSWILYVLGIGLLINLDENSSEAKQQIYQLIAGIGLGALFQVPLIGLQAAMPVADMAVATQAFVLVRSIGTTLGVSIGAVVFTTQTTKNLANIPGYTIPASIETGLRNLVDIPDPVIRAAVIHAYAHGLRMIWIVVTPIAGLGAVLALCVREYSLKTRQVRGKSASGPAAEPEKIGDLEAGKAESEKGSTEEGIEGETEKESEKPGV